MQKPLKWLIYLAVAVLSLAIVVIVGGILALTHIDFSQYRETAEKKMTEQLGRQVSIKGDFDVRVALYPSIKLTDVTIANADWGSEPNAIKLEEFYLRVSPWSLLGRVVIDEIILKNATIRLETKDGKSNLGGKNQTEATQEAGESAAPSPKEIIDSVPIIAKADIAAVNLHIIDHDNDTHSELRIVSIATKEKGRGAEMSVNVSDIIYNDGALGNLTAEVALDKESIVVRSLRQGNGLRGTLEYKANAQFRADIDLTGFRLEVLDVLLGKSHDISGALDGKITLRGKGDSMEKILSNLQGQVNLSSGQVAYGKNIPLLDFIELVNLSSDVHGCVLLIAPVNEGIMSLDAATSSTNIGTAKANGYIDLAQEKLDIIADLSLELPPALSAAGIVKINGDLDNPNYDKSSFQSLSVDIARIGEAAESLLGGLGDLLSPEDNSQAQHDTSLAKCRALAQS